MVSGQMIVYASQVYGVEYSYLFEVYSSSTEDENISQNNYAFKKFNPNTQQTKDHFLGKWARGLGMAMNEIALKKEGEAKRGVNIRNGPGYVAGPVPWSHSDATQRSQQSLIQKIKETKRQQ